MTVNLSGFWADTRASLVEMMAQRTEPQPPPLEPPRPVEDATPQPSWLDQTAELYSRGFGWTDPALPDSRDVIAQREAFEGRLGRAADEAMVGLESGIELLGNGVAQLGRDNPDTAMENLGFVAALAIHAANGALKAVHGTAKGMVPLMSVAGHYGNPLASSPFESIQAVLHLARGAQSISVEGVKAVAQREAQHVQDDFKRNGVETVFKFGTYVALAVLPIAMAKYIKPGITAGATAADAAAVAATQAELRLAVDKVHATLTEWLGGTLATRERAQQFVQELVDKAGRGAQRVFGQPKLLEQTLNTWLEDNGPRWVDETLTAMRAAAAKASKPAAAPVRLRRLADIDPEAMAKALAQPSPVRIRPNSPPAFDVEPLLLEMRDAQRRLARIEEIRAYNPANRALDAEAAEVSRQIAKAQRRLMQKFFPHETAARYELLMEERKLNELLAQRHEPLSALASSELELRIAFMNTDIAEMRHDLIVRLQKLMTRNELVLEQLAESGGDMRLAAVRVGLLRGWLAQL